MSSFLRDETGGLSVYLTDPGLIRMVNHIVCSWARAEIMVVSTPLPKAQGLIVLERNVGWRCSGMGSGWTSHVVRPSADPRLELLQGIAIETLLPSTVFLEAALFGGSDNTETHADIAMAGYDAMRVTPDCGPYPLDFDSVMSRVDDAIRDG